MNRQSSPGTFSEATSAFDWRAGVARAGFLCGLISAIVTVLAAFSFLFSLFFYPLSQELPVLSSGEVVLLLIAMTPVALIGLVLSASGWRSTTRHRQAVAGVALSAFALVPFVIAVLVIAISWTACQPHCL